MKLKKRKKAREDAIEDNPFLAERQKILDDKKATRDSIIAGRKLAQEKKKADFEEKRQKMLSDREAKKNGTVSALSKTEDVKETHQMLTNKEAAKSAAEDARQKQLDARAKILEDRKKVIEDRKKACRRKKNTSSATKRLN